MTFNFIQLLSGFLIAYYLLLVKHTTKWNIENQPSFKRKKYKLGDVINIEFDIKRASIFDKKSELRL